jgi:hypothetical protein
MFETSPLWQHWIYDTLPTNFQTIGLYAPVAQRRSALSPTVLLASARWVRRETDTVSLSAGIEIHLFCCNDSLCRQCVSADTLEGFGRLVPGYALCELLGVSPV